jgi:C-terminal processing protease CtpA/Prc
MKKNVFISKTAQKCMSALMMAILLIAVTTSCDRKSSDNPHKEVNSWILENMEIYYLWNELIPSKTNNTLSPDKYFESLLYKAEDRFSWIQEDYLELLKSLSGVTNEAGYDFNLYKIDDSNILGGITYIKPGTPAANAGLKRGDYFLKINGTKITTSNYSSLIGQISQPHTLGISIISEGLLTENTKDVSLQVITNYAENPVLLDTVYNISDKKTGYLVYNFFASDKGDGSVTYEKELNNIFAKFKSASIDELIVDLRYNGGGAVSTARTLASMISERKTSDKFCIQQYNSLLHNYFSATEGADYNVLYFVNTINSDDSGKTGIPVNTLSGLSTVYFIVSGRSASASELLINGLKPYMNVVLVGETTYGKNVASVTIYEKDAKKQMTNNWGMQPIVGKLANADGYSDYGSGFTPDRKADELDGGVVVKQLGDTSEVLLKTTLNLISGITRSVATKDIGAKAIFIGSAMDRTPARRNMYLTPKYIEYKKDE